MQEQVIPKLLEDRTAEHVIRVWVAGCATGEEAYSIAILFREQMARRDLPPEVQIFATDIDDRALEVARQGIYPEAIARDVSAERLDRFFVRDGETYRVKKDIRETCIFSLHNLITHPPFSKLDLVSCRNLLIYLDSKLQSRVIPLFHFALDRRGYLFLGPSENVTPFPKLFTRVDSKHRLFKARPVGNQRSLFEFPTGPPSNRGQAVIEGLSPPTGTEETVDRRAQRVIEAYIPAFVVIDEHHDIVHFSSGTGRYLQPSPGAASLNLFNIFETTLRPDLRALVHQAMTSRRRSARENVMLPVDGGFQSVNLIAAPLPGVDAGQRLCVVAIQEVGAVKPREPAHRGRRRDVPQDDSVARLEAELAATRERLQTTIEELETSNEEMKSSNEEFQTVNEELQSTNEELTTSKEELQSVNEELETVNAELNAKIESLDRAVSDRKNLFESTQIAAILLDNHLRIKSFTPAVTDIFHLVETDRGRPIAHIANRIAHENLMRDIARVLRTLAPAEEEVSVVDGIATYLMRILPYRTIDNVIDGVVVTFTDITERKGNEEGLAQLAALVESSDDAIIGKTINGIVTNWNKAAEVMFGYSADEMLGRPIATLFPPDRMAQEKIILAKLRRGERLAHYETVRRRKDGTDIDVSLTVSPIHDAAGRVVGASKIARDIAARKRADAERERLLAELNHRVKNTLATVLSIAARTGATSPSLGEFSRAFEGRIRALAGAHDVLSRNLWSGADLGDIVKGALAPFGGDKRSVVVSGERIFVAGHAALALGLVFHELTTNAAKYGALSASSGSVTVSWRREERADEPTLLIDWVERGGPAVEEPGRRGFGRDFITRSVAHELQGTAQLSFQADGLQVTIEAPLAHVTVEAAHGPSAQPSP